MSRTKKQNAGAVRIFLTAVLLFIVAAVSAQVSLAGHTYYNANIMGDAMIEATKDVEKKIADARKKAIEETEAKKGRKLNSEELKEIDTRLEEPRKMLEAIKKGTKTSLSIDFKTEKNMVMKVDMFISDEALKAAGIGWLKRKAMKAAMAMAPKSQKGTYTVQGEMVILNDGEEKDTLYLSADAKYLYGLFDKKTKYTLTRKK